MRELEQIIALFSLVNFVIILICFKILRRLFKKEPCDILDSRLAKSWTEAFSSVSSNHTQVTGALAGFSITIVVLIASLGQTYFSAKASMGIVTSARASMGIMMAAFFCYVSSAILYSISIERGDSHEYFLFSVASQVYYLAVVSSFCGLLPLIDIFAKKLLFWPVMISICGAAGGGYLASSIPVKDLFGFSTKSLFLTGFAAIITGGALFCFWFHYPFPLPFKQALPALLIFTILVEAACFLLSVSSFFVEKIRSKEILNSIMYGIVYLIAIQCTILVLFAYFILGPIMKV